MNKQQLIEMAGGQANAQAALGKLFETRPDLANEYGNNPNGTSATVILEMAVRQAKAKTAAPKRSPFSNFSAKEVVKAAPAQAQSGITAREYAESLLALRKSKEWDGTDYQHPKVKELSSRMMQNIKSVRSGKPEDALKSQSGHYSALDLNSL